jgi:hypothetical protein
LCWTGIYGSPASWPVANGKRPASSYAFGVQAEIRGIQAGTFSR